MASLGGALGGAAQGAAGGAAFGPLGAGIGGAVGGLVGLFSGGGDNEKLKKEADALYAKFGPVDLSDPVVFKKFQQAGVLSPEMEQAISLKQDQAQNYSETHGEDRTNQDAALGALKQMSQTGMSAQDMSQFNQMRSQVAADTNAKTAQILQQAQARGQSGAGDTLATQLQASQSDSQQASKNADSLAANAANARQSALSSYLNGTSNLRNQDASADQINNQNEMARRQFLDANSLSRQTRNVGSQNNANLYNTERQQGVSDSNTKADNNELYRQDQAKRDYFTDQLAYTKARTGADNDATKIDTVNNAGRAKGSSDLLSGLASAAGTVGGLMNKSTPSYDSGVSMAVNPTGLAKTQSQGLDSFNFDPTNKMQASLNGMSDGGEVSGQASVAGDSPKNDTVPTMLSPGEHVIPRSKVEELKWIKGFIDHILGDEKKKK